MNRSVLFGFGLLLTLSFSFAQSEVGQNQNIDERVVLNWFNRWNALDGSEAATEKVVELYWSHAMHLTGPNSRQVGLVTFNGADAIRKMVADFARDNTSIKYRIQTVTAQATSSNLFHTSEGPWGGVGVGVEFVAVYTERATNRRFMHPGAMFFQVQEGRILRLRTYLGHREKLEVTQLD